MKRSTFIFFAWLIAVAGYTQTVKVAAAGNLRFVIDEVKAKYLQMHPDAEIAITLSSSGALTQQIINGASYDFFMAADTKYPNKIKEEGFASGEVSTYAFGKLVLWSNTVDVSNGVEMLTDPKINRIAIAKPEIAPYGARALEFLKYYNVYDKVKPKLVYADNIAQTAQYAQTGNAEIGIIAYALVFGPEMKDKGKIYVIDTKSYKPVEQACVLLKGAENNPGAAKFMEFVLSGECKTIFEKFGYMVP